MFFHIMNNLDKYPLDGVVHFELEIDFPWVKNVIDYMENKCNELGIPFLRIKPRNSWIALYNKYGYPTRVVRWCNSQYKLDCKKQLIDIMRNQNKEVVYYIGLCADEEKRFKKDGSIYPLAELGIYEQTILEWARNKPIFNDYYKICYRQGCLMCPASSYLELAYVLKYYPAIYEKYMNLAKKAEIERNYTIFQSNPKYNVNYVDNIIRTKWLKKLEEKLNSL